MTYEMVEWLGAKADEARDRYYRKIRGWRWWLAVIVPGWGVEELHAWKATVDLFGEAIQKMRASTMKPGKGRPRLSIVRSEPSP